MGDGNFVAGYFFGRRRFKRWTGRERTRPKMPAGPWRAAALLCTSAGVLVAWLIFRDSDAVTWRLVAGGAIGFAVGMYVVESVWERRLSARADTGPIGPRT